MRSFAGADDPCPPPEMRHRQPHLPAYMAGGPDNPLGARAMYIGSTYYRIHGSNEPWTIGQAVSSGCFRMLNNNVLELAKMAPVGTSVRIVNEPYKFGVSGGKIYLEAHEPLSDSGEPSVVDKHTAVINALLKNEQLAGSMRLDWDMVREVVASEDGMPIEIAVPQEAVANHEAAPLEM